MEVIAVKLLSIPYYNLGTERCRRSAEKENAREEKEKPRRESLYTDTSTSCLFIRVCIKQISNSASAKLHPSLTSVILSTSSGTQSLILEDGQILLLYDFRFQSCVIFTEEFTILLI